MEEDGNTVDQHTEQHSEERSEQHTVQHSESKSHHSSFTSPDSETVQENSYSSTEGGSHQEDGGPVHSFLRTIGAESSSQQQDEGPIQSFLRTMGWTSEEEGNGPGEPAPAHVRETHAQEPGGVSKDVTYDVQPDQEGSAEQQALGQGMARGQGSA